MAAIALSELTEIKLDGSGVFDALMRASKVHLEDQWTKGTIRGPEYATVYLGQLESSMQTALAFLQQRHKLGLEAELLQEQIKLAEVQRLQVEAQTKLVIQQEVNAKVEERVLEAQACKLKAEFDFTMKNVEKSAAEVTLLVQRTATEKAQILSLGVDEDSVIGRQKRLYAAQTSGFQRDAEQKAAGLYVDVWKTLRMTDNEWQANPLQGLDDATLGNVMRQLRIGIGIAPG